MALSAPYKRTIRPFVSGEYFPSDGNGSYPRMGSYSADPKPYIRAFCILQRDIRRLFEFIFPADENLSTYSEHIGVLLVRTCFEIETNFKAILRENAHGGDEDDWKMKTYSIAEKSHRLSQYHVQLPQWLGTKNVIKPFESWSASQGKLLWYQDYNKYKHDRVTNLSKANFANLISAWAGLFVLLSSQYMLDEFSDEKQTTGFADVLPPGEFWHGIGGYLKFKFPQNWTDAESYNFQLTAANFSNTHFALNFPY